MCIVCKKGFEVRPQKSAAGFYMGTVTEYGEPNCRLTSKYTEDKNSAYHLELDRQNCMENKFCNSNGRCGLCDKFNKEQEGSMWTKC